MQTCRSTNSNRKIPGFTMLELLVVVGLALLVLTLVFGTLFYGGKSAAKTRAEIVKKSEVLKQFHRIRFQLLNLYKPQRGALLLGEEGMKVRNSEVYFVTTTLKYSKGVGEAGYRMMTDSNGNKYLAYTEFPYPRKEDERFAVNNQLDKWHVASTLIQGLTVEYKKRGEWVKEWDDKSPPGSIRVILWYEGEDVERTLIPYTFMVVPGIESVF